MKFKDIEKRFISGHMLDWSRDMVMNMLAMIPMLETRYPELLDFIAIQTGIDTTQMQKRAEGMSKQLRGMLSEKPSQSDLENAKDNVLEMAKEILDLRDTISKTPGEQERLQANSKGLFNREFDRMLTATGIFAKRFEIEIKEKGGWKGLAKGVKRRTAGVKGFLEGTMTGIETFGRGGAAEQLGSVGLMALAGPLAPLAIAGVGVFKGVRSLITAQKQRQQASLMMAGLAYREMADPTGTRGLFGKAGGFLGQMTSPTPARDEYSPTGAAMPGQALGSKPVTKAMMTGAIISGLSMFFSAQAFNVKWTKRVLAALEKGPGGAQGEGGAGMWQAAMNKMWPALILLGKAAAVLAAAFAGWKAGRWLGENVKIGDKSIDKHLQDWGAQRLGDIDRALGKDSATQSAIGIGIHNRATELQKENPGMSRQEALEISTQESKVKRAVSWGAKAIGTIMAGTPGGGAVRPVIENIERRRTERASNIARETEMQDKSFYQQMVSGLVANVRDIFGKKEEPARSHLPETDIKSDVDDPLLRNMEAPA
jgi:hypothetical protein